MSLHCMIDSLDSHITAECSGCSPTTTRTPPAARAGEQHSSREVAAPNARHQLGDAAATAAAAAAAAAAGGGGGGEDGARGLSMGFR